MKRVLSFLSALAFILTGSVMTASAEENIPVNVEAALYDQLVQNTVYDKNGDGIISDEEYKQINYLNLDLADIASLDFLYDLPDLRSLYLRNGNFTDFSFLKDFKSLTTLQLSNMPQVMDVSFIKDMELNKCYLSGMENITDEQRLELLRYQDAENGAVGFSNMIGAFPVGLFGSSDISLEIDNTDIAQFDGGLKNPQQQTAAAIYGKAYGTTTYTLSYKGEVIHTGTIKIGSETEYATPTRAEQIMPEINTSKVLKPGNTLVLQNQRLCALENGTYAVLRENVKDFSSGTYYDDSDSVFSDPADLVLYNDGTLEINGKTPVGAEGIVFSEVHGAYAISEVGDIYCIYGENDQIVLEKVYSGFGEFYENDSMYMISDTGEIILLELKYTNGKATSRYAFPTGIMNIIESNGNYFIDENNVLWEVVRNVGKEPTIRKRAENVVWVGYRHYGGGSAYGCVHITSDGTAYKAGTTSKLVLDDESENALPYISRGSFTYSIGGGEYVSTGDENAKYHIDSKNRLCMEYDGIRKVTNDAAQYLTFDTDEETGLPNVYYLKLDHTIWCYSFASDTFSAVKEAEPTKLVKGDVNADGVFNVSDVVLLQKWLLAVPDTNLSNWKAADLCEDNRLDVFDLCLMKRELLKEMEVEN